jgi:mRNA-degrading endonuclease RelE of RelBE toxin-antitoxin system
MWRVFVPKSAQKAIARVPAVDARRISAAIEQMAADPYTGDIRAIESRIYRRRVGEYRIVFEVNADFRAVQILRVERRTTTTWRKRS